jgi:uncharacterized phiE125 gp8 family phage protein
MKYLPSSLTINYSSTLPVTVAEAKAHLRVTDSSEDALIELYLRAAIRRVEQHCGISLLSSTVTEIFPSFPDEMQPFDLSVQPATAVTSLSYNTTDSTGTFTTIASANYVTEFDHNKAQIKPVTSWDYDGTVLQVRAIYTAGYTNAAAVPPNLKVAILLILGDFYENRTDADAVQLNRAAIALMQPYLVERY